MIKPKDFDSTKKYPVFMYQYSGPGSQQVANDWLDTNDYWFMMLSQQGYITVLSVAQCTQRPVEAALAPLGAVQGQWKTPQP
jgi:hypothetical protein